MKKALLISVACACLGGAIDRVQAQTFPTDDPVIQRIWEEGMTDRSQVFDLSQALLDSIGPRLMGSPAYAASADWLMDRYAEWGIEAELQEYGTWIGWERGITHIDLISPRVRTLEGMMLAWSPGTDGPVEADVVLLPSFASRDEFDAWLPSVAGKAVAISFPEPTCREDESWQDHATAETVERMQTARDQARRAWNMGMRGVGGGFAQRIADAGAVALLTGRWSAGWGVDKIFSSPTRTSPGFISVARTTASSRGSPSVDRLRASASTPRPSSWATCRRSTWSAESPGPSSPTSTCY